MSWLAELIPPPSLRRPLSPQSFACDFLPAILCYYATAVLVLIPRTFPIRMALLPITLLAAFRAGTQLDFAAGYGHDQQLAYMNQGLTLAMTTLCMRACIWTFQQQPYQRRKSIHKPDPVSTTTGQLLLDALELSFNLRGHGWSWSHGLRLPSETRDVKSIPSFVRSTLVSFLTRFIVFDLVHYSVQWFGPATIGSAGGGSIYDFSLPPPVNYAMSSLITLLSGFTVYFAIQTLYDLLTLIGVVILRQQPTQWPPVFDKPWFSTSLNQFWTLRWHQLFRDNFISFGGKPFAFLTGRAGGVIGAFLASGILHDFGLWGMGRGSDFPSVAGYFVLMGVGVIMEHTWKAATGDRVGGFFGWLWTTAWIIGWGHMLIEAWAVRGLVGSIFIPDQWRPSTLIFGSLVSS